ncbi:b mating type locus, bE1 allele [Mycosarcoma maydis]|uniref:b mating type locus, bE1 allele n=1 Tax=Mycosarcoma maydis TaxID=5270 RepID=UPI0001594FC8|nr:b mating type locus, bE1 allele [Ustilago maydis 521]KIS72159.1 b mating type locus, bE1 allele [Ustilago maydis 521]WJN24848.1 homeodomain transcription factor bE [Ustilago maydis]|eukprot:XP_011386823.1 b mating type locus, bE1 allele [Ustilago maydis 521]
MSSDPNFSLISFLECLNEIEHEFLRDKGENYPVLVRKLRELQQKIPNDIANLPRDPETIQQIHQTTHRIRAVAQAFIRFDQKFVSLCSEVVHGTSKVMQEFNVVSPDVGCRNLSEDLPAYHMRKHFLLTLDNPYPTQEEKETLVRLTNESTARVGQSSVNRPPLEVHQLTLWFINARRRSGWSHILKKFAREDRSRMKHLVRAKLSSSNQSTPPSSTSDSLSNNLDDVLSDNLGRPLTPVDKQQFEDDWASMISWIKYGVKEKVGDWVYDLCAASKKTPKPGMPRPVTTVAKRHPARKTKPAAKPKSRTANPRASTTPSIDSTLDSSKLESTPELSMCSTADTSFSTFGSSLSMSHYNPFQDGNDILQSPTVKARGNRKVKALPKRAGKQQPDEVDNDKQEKFSTSIFDNATEEIKPHLSGHTQVNGGGQTISYLSNQLTAFPRFGTLGSAQLQLPILHTESLSSNSLSTAFG